MKKLAIAAALSLFLLTSALAQDASISIKSKVAGQRPKIIIRSPYDFEKDISLKVRLDPRFIPSDVLIRAVSEMGMTDAKGIRITSGFDIDVQNDLVLAFSGGVAEIIKSSAGTSGLTLIANFRDGNGNFISPPKGSLAVYTTSGRKLCFEYKDVHIAAPKMAFVLLLDRSGSMAEVISDVQDSAQTFLKDLPPSAQCALASFNGGYAWHNKYYQSCNKGDFKLDDLKAEGGTDLYAPLLGAYENLAQDYFRDYQKAVILITDGQIEPDEEMKQKLLTAKKDVLTFVYFLGEKYEHPLIGLADAFLQSTTDLKANLNQYFHSLSTAYGTQKVLEVRPCKGGS
ncbi:conserved exported hypothetical protein [Desulfosarcina cetonica]|uniref:vWA domain-containing protein n=1 Tax=Desulfosarcina cetonica TaxID=90730 RepID=UPI0006D084AE|nr:vWA domain-containing protein [Desulfosarcina cetonica]VTR64444.1 conserved exported hypothetical protein [Desulfosarcina cetonica]